MKFVSSITAALMLFAISTNNPAGYDWASTRAYSEREPVEQVTEPNFVKETDELFADGFESPEPNVVPLCTPDNVMYPPQGYELNSAKTLAELWGPQGIGAALVQVKISGGGYAAYRFDSAMFVEGYDVYTFNGDTSNVGGGGAVGATHRYVSISECDGDLRLSDPTSPHSTLKQSGCKAYPAEGPFLYLNFGPPSTSSNICNLERGKRYVFNVVFDDPSDGYNADTLCNPDLERNLCAFRMAVLN